MRPIRIIGGGICGLALGVALRKRAVPATIVEARVYPRHKVCGEFLAGCSAELLRSLGIDGQFKNARRNRTCIWYWRKRAVLTKRLPHEVLSLSRHTLDASLADYFVALGGELRTAERYQPDERLTDGQVLCTGRTIVPSSPWVGVKIHLLNMPLNADLEMHLARNAYVGLCRVESGRVNLCGLFHKSTLPATHGTRLHYFQRLLGAVGLSELNERLESASADCESFQTIAGLGYDTIPKTDGALRLGDAAGLMPPYTGNGMTRALESAALAVNPLIHWSEHRDASWEACSQAIAREQSQVFGQRLRRAHLLQRLLLHPTGQSILAQCAQLRILPFSLLYRLLH